MTAALWLIPAGLLVWLVLVIRWERRIVAGWSRTNETNKGDPMNKRRISVSIGGKLPGDVANKEWDGLLTEREEKSLLDKIDKHMEMCWNRRKTEVAKLRKKAEEIERMGK